MKLKFVPRGNALCRLPENRVDGMLARYIGRELKLVNEAPTYPATQEPFECEASRDAAKLGGFLALYRCKRDGDLLPYDKATADFCQVPFKELEWKDGEWVEKSRFELNSNQGPATSGRKGK